MQIFDTTGMNMRRISGTDFMVFYPYAYLQTQTNVVVQPTPDVPAGWNLLTWPADYPARSVNSADGIGFDQATDSDTIYIYRNYQYLKLYRNSGQWYYQGAPASIELLPSDGFWYRNTAATNIWWKVGDVSP